MELKDSSRVNLRGHLIFIFSISVSVTRRFQKAISIPFGISSTELIMPALFLSDHASAPADAVIPNSAEEEPAPQELQRGVALFE